MKYKYLRIETKPKVPMGFKDVVAQIDVNHLNKRGIKQEWSLLEMKYSPHYFTSSLITVDREMRIFQDPPNKYIQK